MPANQKHTRLMVGLSMLLVSISLILMTVASILPMWYSLNTTYTTFHVGPFRTCYDYAGSDFCGPSDCTFSSFNSGTLTLAGSCGLARSSKAFLLLGGIFSFLSVIAMAVSLCITSRGCWGNFLSILPLILQIMDVIFYIITLSMVGANFRELDRVFPSYLRFYNTSFYLVIMCLILSSISCIIYGIFGVCLKRRADDQSAETDIALSPLMNSPSQSNLQTPMLMTTPAPNAYGSGQYAPSQPYQQLVQYPPQSYPIQYPAYYPPQLQPPVQAQPHHPNYPQQMQPPVQSYAQQPNYSQQMQPSVQFPAQQQNQYTTIQYHQQNQQPQSPIPQ